jgi:hypothetical protein
MKGVEGCAIVEGVFWGVWWEVVIFLVMQGGLGGGGVGGSSELGLCDEGTVF